MACLQRAKQVATHQSGRGGGAGVRSGSGRVRRASAAAGGLAFWLSALTPLRACLVWPRSSILSLLPIAAFTLLCVFCIYISCPRGPLTSYGFSTLYFTLSPAGDSRSVRTVGISYSVYESQMSRAVTPNSTVYRAQLSVSRCLL